MFIFSLKNIFLGEIFNISENNIKVVSKLPKELLLYCSKSSHFVARVEFFSHDSFPPVGFSRPNWSSEGSLAI
jgi:hypothetical protein